MKYTVFVIDDEQSIRDAVKIGFEDIYNVHVFRDAEQGLENITEKSPDLILLDIGLPGMNGIKALKKIKEHDPEIIVVMITAYEDVETVITAMKLGAEDYVIKPLDMDRLKVTISNALENIRLKKEVRMLQEKYLKENTPVFIREGEAIEGVMDFVEKIARSPDTPVLILGETGTGKELVAQAIHYRSPNFKGPFITVNCAAVPNELIESELFGYVKGAFSGARDSGKKGMVEEAAGGTLFLDEVGDLRAEAQAKLLRFLENGEFYRVGSTEKKHVNTRVVSATNMDLEKMIDKGKFRKDLIFRLGVVKVAIPSLNERKEEIPVLAEYFLNKFNSKFGRNFTGLTADAQHMLTEHEFTGHVRELRNMIEKAVLVGKGSEITVDDLGRGVIKGKRNHIFKEEENSVLPELTEQGMDFERFQKEIEKLYVDKAMELAKGNMKKAAELLGLNYFTFRNRRKKLEE